MSEQSSQVVAVKAPGQTVGRYAFGLLIACCISASLIASIL